MCIKACCSILSTADAHSCTTAWPSSHDQPPADEILAAASPSHQPALNPHNLVPTALRVSPLSSASSTTHCCQYPTRPCIGPSSCSTYPACFTHFTLYPMGQMPSEQKYPGQPTAVRVRDRGLSLERPEVTGRKMRRLAISTTSLPENFFSNSRTSRC